MAIMNGYIVKAPDPNSLEQAVDAICSGTQGSNENSTLDIYRDRHGHIAIILRADNEDDLEGLAFKGAARTVLKHGPEPTHVNNFLTLKARKPTFGIVSLA